MAKRMTETTPKADGFRMPAEFEPQAGVWMLWPERPDNWRGGGKPAQRAFCAVAEAIARFEPVTMCVSAAQYQNARARLPEHIRVVEMSANDAWVRDCGPTFLVNDAGELRAVDWEFNAWGGLVDGLYFPWDKDDQVAQKICELAGADSYRTDGFVLEGGSIHVDGEGTVLTTEMCLLSRGRNPGMSREEIERKLCDYLGCEKVLWIRDGIDPDETNGHIDDVACFIRPGEVACIWTEDKDHPFYQEAQDAFRTLSQATDAKGRRLKVHKLCLTKKPCLLEGAETIDTVEGTIPRENGEVSIASYMNFLIVNGAVILAALLLALDLRRLQEAGEKLARGDYAGSPALSRWALPDLRAHADHLGSVGAGVQRAVEERMKSEHLKTELITNVSHDIKTPITSIVNYVDLLKKEPLPEGPAREYVAVLDRQSQRLKKLTEDLVEASKAATGNIPVVLEPTDLHLLLGQVVGEYAHSARIHPSFRPTGGFCGACSITSWGTSANTPSPARASISRRPRRAGWCISRSRTSRAIRSTSPGRS